MVQYKKSALKNKLFFVFFLDIKINNFYFFRNKNNGYRNTRINKKTFYKLKQSFDLLSIETAQILVSDKFKHNDEGFKYFIGYRNDLFTHYALCYLK